MIPWTTQCSLCATNPIVASRLPTPDRTAAEPACRFRGRPGTMLRSDLNSLGSTARKPKVCAVSYLNTVPLVWGAVEGAQKQAIDLSFAVPSVCASRVAEGIADVGLVPVYELDRLGFGWIPGLGIASRGAVRSILLVSSVEPGRIRRLAADSGSRTSVQLARIILAERYGATPEVFAAPPVVETMLENADAALLIGDAALAIDPVDCGLNCLDLGDEWNELTGLPMVFAVWAGRPQVLTPSLEASLNASAQYGLAQLDRIIEHEAARRGFPVALVEQYLTRHVQFLLGPEDEQGMQAYLSMARAINADPAGVRPAR